MGVAGVVTVSGVRTESGWDTTLLLAGYIREDGTFIGDVVVGTVWWVTVLGRSVLGPGAPR